MFKFQFLLLQNHLFLYHKWILITTNEYLLFNLLINYFFLSFTLILLDFFNLNNISFFVRLKMISLNPSSLYNLFLFNILIFKNLFLLCYPQLRFRSYYNLFFPFLLIYHSLFQYLKFIFKFKYLNFRFLLKNYLIFFVWIRFSQYKFNRYLIIN